MDKGELGVTTIAYREGVVAGDTGSAMGYALTNDAIKVARGVGGAVHGCSGAGACCSEYLEWVKSGYRGNPPMPEMDGESSTFIILKSERVGSVEIISARGTERYETAYFAIGAGAEVALGAMHAGADAEGAVNAAIAHSTCTSGRVISVKLED